MSLHCPRSGLSPLPLLSTPSLSLGCLGFLLILILGRMAHRNTPSFSPGELLYGPLFSLSFRWPGSPYQTALTLIWASQERDSALNRTLKRFATTGLLCFPVRVACFKPSRKLLSPHLGTAGFSLLVNSDGFHLACFSQGTLVARTVWGLTLPSPAVPAIGNSVQLSSTKEL